MKAWEEDHGQTGQRGIRQRDYKTFRAVKPDFLAYAGYVWATTAPIVNAYIGVNAHPADLSIEKDGRRAYAGANGVRDALLGAKAR